VLSNRTLLLAAAVALCGIDAYAQAPFSPPQPPWYLEASGGEARTSDQLVRNRESTIVNGFDIHSDFDAKDAAWKFGGGWRALPWLALELNYADLGRVKLETALTGPTGLPAGIAIDRKVSGWGVDAVFSVPVAPRFALYGRAGAFRSHLETSARLSGNIAFTNGDSSDSSRSTTRDETVGRFGAGLRWEAWRNGALHAEYERYRSIGKPFAIGGSGTTGEADVDAWWIGVSQAF
jgi:opacity protein-like surface antigen